MQYYDPGFYGTDTYWKHPLYGFNYTDSVKHFCTEYQAYWILDVIGSYLPTLSKYPFLVISFDVVEYRCDFYAQEDTGKERVVEQYIPFTDMGVSIKLYLIDNVLLFPADY